MQVALELHHVGTVESHVYHLALVALIEACAHQQGAAALEVVEDIVAHSLQLVGDDEHGFVALHTFDNEVDNLALNEDDDDGVDGQAYVAESHEGAQRDDAVDNHHQGAEANLGVLVQYHADDVAAAAGGAAAEYHADGHSVNKAGDNGVEEVVWHEPAPVVGYLNHGDALDGSVDNLAVEDNRVVAPQGLKDICGHEDEGCGEDGLETELGTENPGAYDEQGHIHADGVEGYLPWPHGIQYVGDTICAAGSHQVGVDEHHVADSEQNAAANEQQVGPQFFFPVFFHSYICHNRLFFSSKPIHPT